jgi:NTP pyrophosphatase (non-canonical NTP hydrolase)
MYNFDIMEIKDLTLAMERFVREKGWFGPESSRPQTARNLAVSLSIEAAEILELFQWNEKPPDPNSLASECADVALYLLQLASVSNIDLETAILEKLALNRNRKWDSDTAKKKEA